MKSSNHPESSSSDHSSESQKEQETDIHLLVTCYIEGELNDEQWLYLESKKGDSEFQKAWQSELSIHAGLMAHAESNSMQSQSVGQSDLMQENVVRPKVSAWQKWGSKASAIAAAVVIGFFVFQFFQGGETVRESEPALAGDKPVHAIVLGSEADGGSSLKEGNILTSGIIRQDTGWTSVQTLKGVTVTLQAPFEMKMKSVDEMELISGAARVHVPEGAKGFVLQTPTMEVLDLGTEFAVRVDADGADRCRVFEGKADVMLVNTAGETISKKRLNANESIQSDVEKQHLVTIQENDADYHEMRTPPRTKLALPSTYAEEVKSLNPLGYWRFEELDGDIIPNEVIGKPYLRAKGTAHLIEETNGNHSGQLNRYHERELFIVRDLNKAKLAKDFSFSIYFQMDWLSQYAIVNAYRFDKKVKGQSFLMRAYADFERSGLRGTCAHTVLRDPPAWEGGEDLYGDTLLRPLYWHHMVATRKDGVLTLYLDGERVGSREVVTASIDFASIIVGRASSNPEQNRQQSFGLMGRVDEFAIFDRALSESEVKILAAGQQIEE